MPLVSILRNDMPDSQPTISYLVRPLHARQRVEKRTRFNSLILVILLSLATSHNFSILPTDLNIYYVAIQHASFARLEVCSLACISSAIPFRGGDLRTFFIFVVSTKSDRRGRRYEHLCGEYRTARRYRQRSYRRHWLERDLLL